MTKSLTLLAEEAFGGSRSSFHAFLRLFLQTELFIPDRVQPHGVGHLPPATSPFFPFFSYESEDRCFIPCFEREEQLAEWSSTPLVYRRSSGLRLFDLIPPDYWLIFNPGSAVEKLFSPWEVSLLRLGSDEVISEIVSELFDAPSEEFLDAAPPLPAQHSQLFDEITQLAREDVEIERAWILELGLMQDTPLPSRELLVGLLVTERSKEGDKRRSLTDRQTAIHHRLAPLMIGRGTLRVFVCTDLNHGIFGPLLATYKPFFERTER